MPPRSSGSRGLCGHPNGRPLSSSKRRLQGSPFIPVEAPLWLTAHASNSEVETSATVPDEPCAVRPVDTPVKRPLQPDSRSTQPTLEQQPPSTTNLVRPHAVLDPKLTSYFTPVTNLPLEVFDDPEYETADLEHLLPACEGPRLPDLDEFVQNERAERLPATSSFLTSGQTDSGLPASSPYYTANCPTWEHEWRSCKAIGYDAARRLVLIEWNEREVGPEGSVVFDPALDTARPRRKWVTRLNIKFDGESQKKFDARVHYARSQAKIHEERVDEWLSVVAVRCKVSEMPLDMVERLASQAHRALRPWLLTSQQSVREAALEVCLEHFQWHWTFAMKQNYLEQNMVPFQEPCSLRARNAEDVFPVESLITVPALPTTLCLLRNSVDSEASSLSFPAPAILPLSVGLYHEAVAHMVQRVAHHLESVWYPQSKKMVTDLLLDLCVNDGEHPKVKRLLRLADMIYRDHLYDMLLTFQFRLHEEFNFDPIAYRKDNGVYLHISKDAPYTAPKMVLDVVLIEVKNERCMPSAFELRLVPDRAELMATASSMFASLREAFAGLPTFGPGTVGELPSIPNDAFLHALGKVFDEIQEDLNVFDQHFWILSQPGGHHTELLMGSDAHHDLKEISKALAAVKKAEAVLIEFHPRRTRILGVNLNGVLRRLRLGSKSWRHYLATKLAGAMESQTTAVLQIQAWTTELLTLNAHKSTAVWRRVRATSACKEAVLDRVEEHIAILQHWWDVAEHPGLLPVDEDPEVLARYWRAVGAHRQLVCEFTLAQERVERALATYRARVRFLADYVAGAMIDHAKELASLSQADVLSAGAPMQARLHALELRVSKVTEAVNEARAILEDIRRPMQCLGDGAFDISKKNAGKAVPTTAGNEGTGNSRSESALGQSLLEKEAQKTSRAAPSSADPLEFLRHLRAPTSKGDLAGDLAHDPPVFQEYDLLEREVRTTAGLWGLVTEVTTTLEQWKAMRFTLLPRMLIAERMNKWQLDCMQLRTTYLAEAGHANGQKGSEPKLGTSARVVPNALDSVLPEGNIPQPGSSSSRAAAAIRVLTIVEERLATFLQPWPVIWALGSPNLQMKHWFQVTKRIGITANDLELLSLQQALELPLDLVHDILTTYFPSTLEHKHNAHRSGLATLGSSNDSRVAGQEGTAGGVVDPTAVFLSCVLKPNSLSLEAVGPNAYLWSQARTTATVSFASIRAIQCKPPEIRRYLGREGEWSRLELPDALDPDENRCATTEARWTQTTLPSTPADWMPLPSNAATAPIAAVQCGSLLVRRGVWHTRLGDVFYFLTAPVDEACGEMELELRHLEDNAVSIVLSQDEDIPFCKLTITLPKGS